MASPSAESKPIEGSTVKRPAEGDGTEHKRQKISFGLSSKTALTKKFAPGKLGHGLQKQKAPSTKPLLSRSAVFNDDDDEPIEMPREAKMLMRNIGRDTPTSTGPNSFGKTKQGFCNAEKVLEKSLKQTAENINKDVGKKS